MGAFSTRRNDDNSDVDDDIITECVTVIACDVSLVALFFISNMSNFINCTVLSLI